MLEFQGLGLHRPELADKARTRCWSMRSAVDCMSMVIFGFAFNRLEAVDEQRQRWFRLPSGLFAEFLEAVAQLLQFLAGVSSAFGQSGRHPRLHEGLGQGSVDQDECRPG